jgi:hypothetical protein
MLNVCKVGPNLRPPGLFLLLYGNSFWAGIQQGLRYIQRAWCKGNPLRLLYFVEAGGFLVVLVCGP